MPPASRPLRMQQATGGETPQTPSAAGRPAARTPRGAARAPVPKTLVFGTAPRPPVQPSPAPRPRVPLAVPIPKCRKPVQ